MHELNITGARLRDGQIANISISDGKICAIGQDSPAEAARTIDAGEGLVTESFCNPHLHLDKVHTLAELGDAALADYHGADMGKAMTAIERAAAVKRDYSVQKSAPRIDDALRNAVEHGNTHIRALADVDPTIGLKGVRALLDARERWSERLCIQVVAFPQDGLVREPGTHELLIEAMELGADVVGGIPWIEWTEDAAREHVRIAFEVAQHFDADVSMLVDDAGDPGLRTTEMMAIKAIETGWQGRVLAHHARAMAMYPEPYFQKLTALLRQAKMGIITDPHTGPLHARVRGLLESDCLVALGQDDISDAYYPFGRNSMLEVAFLAAHLLWMTKSEDLETLYDMITTKAAQTMGVEHKLSVGSPANLVVLEAPNVLEALRSHQKPSHVIYEGRVVSG